jgi:transforming growth factor-beta-induced protein
LTPPWVLHLTQVLANHATTPEFGGVVAADLVSGPVPMLSGENVTVTVGDTVTIASVGSPDDATVIEPDLMADNGVIHKVDGVLLPSFVSTDLIGLANSSLSGDFTSLFKYFEVIGGQALLGAIGEEGVTVFAPTDEAFAALGEETLANLSASDLTAILSNHVVTGVVPSVAISNGQTIKSLGGLELTFTITDDGNGTVFMVNNATITMPNVLANNGIVHAIDMVLLKAPAQPEPSPMATPEGAPVAAPTGGAAPSAPTKPKPPTGAVSSAMASSFSVAVGVAAVLAFLV